jgi:pimeloyl-ACP methyl ester carboxylesterase/DNA-binding NarL/FixJ family response regulator
MDTDQSTARIIDQIYAVVTTPEDYDDFMLELQSQLDALPGRGEPDRASLIEQHLSRASMLVDIVTPWRRSNDDGLTAELAKKHQATLVIDHSGVIVDANMAARTTYGLGTKASVDDLPLNEIDREKLLSRARDVIHGKSQGNHPNTILKLHNLVTDGVFLATLSPFVSEKTQEVFAIVKTGDIAWPSYLGPILTDLFDLTNAEIEVVRLLVQGKKIDEIAASRSTSNTTVRSQLRSIFSKTGTDTQLDCVRTVFGLAIMHDTDEGQLLATRIQAAQETAFFPRDSQLHIFTLSNKRQIEYSDFADADGRVVLFYHDQAFGDVWFCDAVTEAQRLGLRVVGPRRPGFGRTTLYPGQWCEPRRFAPEVVELIDSLGIERVTLLTLSSGLVHGLALAELIPDRIAAITAAHPLLPVRSDADLEGTNGYNYLIPHTRLHFPHAIRFLCKAGFAFVSASGPGAFGKAVMRASPWDVEWISRADILPVMEKGRRVHEHQGYVGNFGDISYARDWSDLLTNCKVPVRLVIGENDRNVQWKSAQEWSERLTHVDLHVLPESGYMVHHQQANLLLSWLDSDLSTANVR